MMKHLERRSKVCLHRWDGSLESHILFALSQRQSMHLCHVHAGCQSRCVKKSKRRLQAQADESSRCDSPGGGAHRVVFQACGGPPKPSGKVRLCVDYTALNNFVHREQHVLPNVDHTLGQLGGTKFFTKLDANSGFYQIPLSKDSLHSFLPLAGTC